MRIAILKWCLFSLALFATESTSSPDNVSNSDAKLNSESSGIKDSKRTHHVIQLAFFGDNEFGARFQHNSEKIQKYLQVVMYDVHLRFQTLTSLNISFRVTSINTFKSLEDQQFLEQSRHDNGSYSLEQLADNFQKWTFSKLDTLPKFDIAVLLLGSASPDLQYFLPDTICRGRQDDLAKVTSVSILSMERHPFEELAIHLARILGAKNDDDPETLKVCPAKPNAHHQCCILDDSKRHAELRPHFFSYCTDKLLKQHLFKLLETDKLCLDEAAAEKSPLIDSNELFKNPAMVHAYTMQEQCRLLSNDTNAEAKLQHCLGTYCLFKNGTTDVFFAPLEGSKCGNSEKGRCLRGVCTEVHVQIQNVATEKCLVPQNSQFSAEDNPVLRNCDEVPFDTLLGTEIERNKNYEPTMVYSTSDGPRTKRLRLGDNLNLKFDPRKGQPESIWIIKRLVDAEFNEFLIKNKAKGLCAMASVNGVNVNVTSDCSGGDAAARWRFVRVETNTKPVIPCLFQRFNEEGYFVNRPKKQKSKNTEVGHDEL